AAPAARRGATPRPTAPTAATTAPAPPVPAPRPRPDASTLMDGVRDDDRAPPGPAGDAAAGRRRLHPAPAPLRAPPALGRDPHPGRDRHRRPRARLPRHPARRARAPDRQLDPAAGDRAG